MFYYCTVLIVITGVSDDCFRCFNTLKKNWRHWLFKIVFLTLFAPFFLKHYLHHFHLHFHFLPDVHGQMALKKQSFSLTFPCYQQIIIQRHLPLCLQPFLPLFRQAPRAAAAARCRSLPMRKGSGCSANLLERAPLLSSCSSTLNLLLSLLHGNSCSNTCSLAPLRFIVFHTGLRRPNRLTLTVMKLPHIEPARENNI